MKISQLSTFIENRSGRLRAACEALAARGINIHTLCLADSRDFGILRLIVADPPAGKAALEAAGYVAQLTDVLAVEVPELGVLAVSGTSRTIMLGGKPVVWQTICTHTVPMPCPMHAAEVRMCALSLRTSMATRPKSGTPTPRPLFFIQPAMPA